jgi:epoxyqueuosine reductase
LIDRKLGSYTFIGEIITDIELNYDEPSPLSYCGSCSKCINSCPTGAILPDKTIDSNKCISYLTIEHKGEIPGEFAGKTGGWVFGCDICQEVCPWNSKTATSSIPELFNQKDRILNALGNWNALDRPAKDEILGSTSLGRAGYEAISRNLAFAAKSK